MQLLHGGGGKLGAEGWLPVRRHSLARVVREHLVQSLVLLGVIGPAGAEGSRMASGSGKVSRAGMSTLPQQFGSMAAHRRDLCGADERNWELQVNGGPGEPPGSSRRRYLPVAVVGIRVGELWAEPSDAHEGPECWQRSSHAVGGEDVVEG